MPRSKQPNLIYVFADQLRYQSLGYTGDDKAKTPRIDALSEEGVNFTNCVSGHPMCAPYRASLFTGKYSSSTGMVINELRMNPNHECFGHVLHNAGYDTYYIGKWHLWADELGIMILLKIPSPLLVTIGLDSTGTGHRMGFIIRTGTNIIMKILPNALRLKAMNPMVKSI